MIQVSSLSLWSFSYTGGQSCLSWSSSATRVHDLSSRRVSRLTRLGFTYFLGMPSSSRISPKISSIFLTIQGSSLDCVGGHVASCEAT